MNTMKLRQQAKSLRPTVHIGKAGLTKAVIQEIKKRLDKNKLIKIKILKSALLLSNKKNIVESLSNSTGGLIVDSIGNVVVLAKRTIAGNKKRNN